MPIVDPFAAVPIFVAHLSAPLPVIVTNVRSVLVVALVLMVALVAVVIAVVLMVLRERRPATEGRSQGRHGQHLFQTCHIYTPGGFDSLSLTGVAPGRGIHFHHTSVHGRSDLRLVPAKCPPSQHCLDCESRQYALEVAALVSFGPVDLLLNPVVDGAFPYGSRPRTVRGMKDRTFGGEAIP